MASVFDYYLRFREMIVGESYSDSMTELKERMDQMAADLSALISEVDRVNETQKKAIDYISGLVSDVQNISTQLASKTIEAENSVDMDTINGLITKLKTSTDNLSSAIETTKAG